MAIFGAFFSKWNGVNFFLFVWFKTFKNPISLHDFLNLKEKDFICSIGDVGSTKFVQNNDPRLALVLVLPILKLHIFVTFGI